MNNFKKSQLIVILFFLILLSCENNKKGKVTISLVSFISSHPIFMKIENSFKEELSKQMGDSVKYSIILGNAQGNMEALPTVASSAVNISPNIIVSISTPVTQAIMRAADDKTKIVYTFVSDTLNLKDALQKTNSTGLSDIINYKGNIELIQSIYGEDVKIGILYNPNEANSIKGISEIKDILKTNNRTKLVLSTVTNENEVPIVSKNLIRNVDVILSIGDNTVASGLKAVINNAFESKKGVFAIDEGSIEEMGAVGGISVDYEKLGKETAVMVANIIKKNIEPRSIKKIMLHGNKLILNKKVINSLKLNINRNLYLKADLIIE